MLHKSLLEAKAYLTRVVPLGITIHSAAAIYADKELKKAAS
jgi:hypothetical protein